MKKTNITLSIALAAVFSSSVVFAEAEVTGKIIHESGFFSEAGSTIGDWGVSTYTAQGVGTTATPAHAKNDAMKRETTARIYIDGDANEISDGATYHVELNLMTDGKGNNNYDSHESYTQRDALREAYVDSQVGDWSLRTGKQQVVWGTADGMKLLDMINPSDYGEMAQNQMEDSRIPVWMINAETTNEDGSEFQVIVSQPKENVFAGLNRHIATGVRVNNPATMADETLNSGTDTGHAFIMKGPDTITGVHDGFLNITPDLGGVANRFAGGFGGSAQLTAFGMQGFVVGGAGSASFEPMTMAQMAGAMAYNQMLHADGTVVAGQAVANANYNGANGGVAGTYTDLPDAFEGAVVNVANALNGGSSTPAQRNAITGAQMLQYGFASMYDANLADDKTDGVNDTAFDYMSKTAFMTFDAFAGAGSEYVYEMPKDSDVDVAFRTKNSTADGVNYSLNGSYNYDKNPIIDLSWRNATGNKLAVNKMITEVSGVGALTGYMVADVDATTGYTLMLTDTAIADGARGSGNYGGAAGAAANLRFTQKVKRVVNLGGSFDMAVETDELGPVVIRGEALYTKGAYSPVIDKDKLAHGDLVGALEMVKGDRAKIVLGVDITALTNMMVSAQFIQDSDLDFVDGTERYTADYATMHMTNGFNKATKDKNFYSLFFSKPFGASGEHRWNNIFMFEENGGKWNRLDAEFSIDDDT
ncbi:MAG: hypothetical protein HOE35_02085, partial [Candidatus Ruthia sp.]|nr:hypothetical protein [Candidatus Ruthturnera sp.]MBT5236661.1 hypothetical protein [Candidatus Neomarinimicrobiota bacterium]